MKYAVLTDGFTRCFPAYVLVTGESLGGEGPVAESTAGALLAAFQLVLHEMTRGLPIIGITSLTPPLEEFESTCGSFFNYAPFWLDVIHDPRLGDHVLAARQRLQEAVQSAFNAVPFGTALKVRSKKIA